MQNTERRRINVNRDEILTTDVGISELMNVRNSGTRDCASRTFATSVVTQTLLVVVLENRFPHQSFLNSYHTVRAVVIVNRRLLTRPPTDHQHLDRLIATNSMAPVIAFLEAKIRLQIYVCNLDVRDPVIQIFEGWGRRLAV